MEPYETMEKNDDSGQPVKTNSHIRALLILIQYYSFVCIVFMYFRCPEIVCEAAQSDLRFRIFLKLRGPF